MATASTRGVNGCDSVFRKIKTKIVTTKNITIRIIQEAWDWTLWDWKKFRSLDNYWDIRDDYVRRSNKLLQKKDYSRHNELDNNFQLWKLKKMIKFNKNYKK